MDVRGFTSPNEHQVRWHQLVLRRWDWFALGLAVVLWWGENCLGGRSLKSDQPWYGRSHPLQHRTGTEIFGALYGHHLQPVPKG